MKVFNTKTNSLEEEKVLSCSQKIFIFLSKTSILPISIVDGKLVFKLFSLKTFLHLCIFKYFQCIFNGWNIFYMFMICDVMFKSAIETMFMGSFIENFTMGVNFAFQIVAVVLPILLYHGLSKLDFSVLEHVSMWPPKIDTTSGKINIYTN